VATEVWIDERHAQRFLTGLPRLLGPAGLGEPHCVSFAVPACFAAGYGLSPAQLRDLTAAAPVVPAPRPRSAAEEPATSGANRRPSPG
jgi:hypothetical protein